MTNAPRSRKTHITRIVGTNRDGERLDHIWVDVERMDIVKSAMQIPPHFQWQGVQRKLRWCDDPDGDDYSPTGPSSRLTEVVKVCDPETEDVDDPDEWVPVRVIRGMRSRGGSSELQGQGFMDRFVKLVTDADLESSRVVEFRRIPHYDTNIDDLAQAAFDADQSRKEYVVPGELYVKTGVKDEDQYVEHEVITFLKHKGNNRDVDGLGRQTKLRNQYLIDESDPASFEIVGSKGFNPPYRLDPFQNIVNCQFSPRVYVVITAAKSDYATAGQDGVEILETRQAPGPQSTFMTGTLIECSANTGEEFAKLNSSLMGGPGGEGGGEGSTLITAMVYPKTEEVLASWWTYAQKYQGQLEPDNNILDAGPFLWISEFRAYGPCSVSFKIKIRPHLVNPGPGVKDKITQAYATSGSHSGPGGGLETRTVTGFRVEFYRTDKDGAGQIYRGNVSAWRSEIVETPGTGDEFKGIGFGKDPALIPADIPYVP